MNDSNGQRTRCIKLTVSTSTLKPAHLLQADDTNLTDMKIVGADIENVSGVNIQVKVNDGSIGFIYSSSSGSGNPRWVYAGNLSDIQIARASGSGDIIVYLWVEFGQNPN